MMKKSCSIKFYVLSEVKYDVIVKNQMNWIKEMSFLVGKLKESSSSRMTILWVNFLDIFESKTIFSN